MVDCDQEVATAGHSRSRIFNREKFLPKEDLVKQIMDMGICR